MIKMGIFIYSLFACPDLEHLILNISGSQHKGPLLGLIIELHSNNIKLYIKEVI